MPERGHALGSAIRFLRMLFVAIASLALLSLTLMIVADTFFRYVFATPFPASVEISQLIQPYVVFLPLAYALAGQMSGGVARRIAFVPYLVGLVFFTIMAIMSGLNFWESYRIDETMLAAVKLYWWIGKLAMPLGTAMIALECAYQVVLLWEPPGAQAGGAS